MHFSTAVAAVAALAPVANAHGLPGRPQIMGLNPKDLKARSILSNLGVQFAKREDFMPKAAKSQLQTRQGQCGPGVGSCGAGLCCSPEGNCGTTIDYCYAPGCQYKYGPGCPENATPAGTNTSTIARTKLGNVQYGGGGIYDCVTPGTVAITYDDGPLQQTTAHILDVLASHNAKATFFITGNNIGKGEIDITPELTADIQRMDTDGHQIASHTWTHQDLDAISSADRHNQMYKNEMALRNIVGKIPTYMRPPYSSCTNKSPGGGSCETDLKNLGYHVTYFDLDTDDYEHDDPTLIQTSKDWYYGNMSSGNPSTSSWLVIGHDIHQQTAYNLTDYMLSTLTQLGYRSVTVGECLGDPATNWYRAAGGAATPSSTKPASTSTRASSGAASPTASKKVTPDATCGGTNGYTCLGSSFGNCCSPAGWCGSTSAYCGTGCQTAFGNCGGNGVVSSSAAPVSSKPASSTPAASSKPASTPASSKPASTPASTKPASSTKASATPSSAPKTVSPDASCGGTKGYTCQNSGFGNCCSQYGWCGSTANYCGTGCLKDFGTCT